MAQMLTASGDVGEIPSGWLATRLAEIIQPSKEKIEPSEVDGDTPYISLEHIEQDSGRIIACGKARDVTSTKNVFHRGDVLYGKLRPYLNKVAIPDFSGICSTDILVFPRSDLIHNSLVAHFLRQRSVVSFANEHSRGVQLPRVSFDALGQLTFPLPPLAEQKRIVAKVEEVLAPVRAARERLAKVPTIVKRFRQSVLAAACSGRLTEAWRGATQSSDSVIPDSWRRSTVQQVCSTIVDCAHSTPKWTSDGYICLRTTNFRSGYLDLDQVRYVSAETYSERSARLEPQPDDVLYSREGGILGIACLFPLGLRACLGQRMMLMRCSPEILPAFMMHVLNCPDTVSQVEALTGGTASPHLNVGDVKQFSIPLPPIEEQSEILARVDGCFRLAEVIEARTSGGSRRTSILTQALLAKAFRGELTLSEADIAVAEGREYETAEQLLKRVQTERATVSPVSRRRRYTPQSSNPNRDVAENADAIAGPSGGKRKQKAVGTEIMQRTSVPDEDIDKGMLCVRVAFGAGAARDRETALRDVARALGHARLGTRVRETVESLIRTAVRRRILTSDGRFYALAADSANEYSREDLIDSLRAAVNGVWTERSDAIRATAHHLGYRRVSPAFKAAMKSAINGAIRRNLIESNGLTIRRAHTR